MRDVVFNTYMDLQKCRFVNDVLHIRERKKNVLG